MKHSGTPNAQSENSFHLPYQVYSVFLNSGIVPLFLGEMETDDDHRGLRTPETWQRQVNYGADGILNFSWGSPCHHMNRNKCYLPLSISNQKQEKNTLALNENVRITTTALQKTVQKPWKQQ